MDTIAVSKLAYLSLGSNVGDRAENLRAAIARLRTAGEIKNVSSFYETEPLDFRAQPWFLNCVLAMETNESARTLLGIALRIEEEMGRQRTRVKGPRTIDIDILLLGDDVADEQGLRIPHPMMPQRRFVLEPLAEIAPDLVHPVLKRTVRELLGMLPAGQAVERL